MIIGFIIVMLCLILWIVWDNSRIVVSTIGIKSQRLPQEFDGYRIVQVSDLHNDEFGEKNEILLEKIRGLAPDMIAITGDLLDSRRTDVQKALNFINGAVKIASCYYVTGNHESRMKEKEYKELEKGMIEAGVIILRNQTSSIEKDGAKIKVIGMDDPRFVIATDRTEKMETALEKTMTGLLEEVSEEYTILLSHRPELFEWYCKHELDLVLSGHVHGGQFRLPLIGGIIGPGQGMLPDYVDGLYTKEDTNMIVSRGLGQSIVPFRINNPPELVLVTLNIME